jgi:hypothetical protein
VPTVLPAALLLGSLQAPVPTPAIQGGYDDTTHTFAVAVCGGAPGACDVLCSGVLIAPNLVVTARHCVESTNLPSGGAVDCTTTEFEPPVASAASFSITTSASVHQSTSGWHAVTGIVTPGSAMARACGDDVALLVLADAIAPAEAVPATPNVTTPLTDHAVFEAAETAIGYGLSPSASDAGEGTAGYRRWKPDVPILCIPDDPSSAVACTVGASLGANEFETGDGVCPGDSGSGAFAQTQFDDGSFVVLGVLSRGAGDASQCIGGTYTRLDVWSAFLVANARSAALAGGYAVPTWAGGAGGYPLPLPVTGGCSVAPALGRPERTPGGPGASAFLAALASLVSCRRSRRRLS